MSFRIILTALAVVSSVAAQAPAPAPAPPPAAPAPAQTPLADRRIPFDQIPPVVDTSDGPRGRQTGFNQCNSTTEGPNSLCQTAFLNNLADFCLWGPSKPNSLIADTEGELVAWCTQPGTSTSLGKSYGGRIIPSGALKGVQFIQTPDYVQVTGVIDQKLINIQDGDSGGEEDPHGADGRGNPLGSLVYSNAYPSSNGNNSTMTQVIEWHLFLGGNRFCFKACDPAGKNAAKICEHIYDRIGCAYNAPAAYEEGVFLKCKGDSQDPPGVFTGADGKVSTYQQPPESLGAIQSIPYQPKVPATSQCVTYQSADLYAAAAKVAPNPNGTSTTTKGSSATASTGLSGSRTSGGSAATATSKPNGARRNVAGAVAGLGVVAAGLAIFA